MGTIKTTNIEPIADNGTVTLGSSGDTFTLGSGVKQSNMLYPAFMATMGTGNQSITDITITKVQLTNEVIDTDNAFDNSTNYRFTVPSGGAGKYLINGGLTLRSTGQSNLEVVYAYLYKNGSAVNVSMASFKANPLFQSTQNFSVLIDLVAGDYLELFGYIEVVAGTPSFDPGLTSDTIKSTYLAGYRIGS
jgi:hypothetical protein